MLPTHNRRSITAPGATAKRASASTPKGWKPRRQPHENLSDEQIILHNVDRVAFSFGYAASCCGATPCASAATNNTGPASNNSEFSAGQHPDERSEQGRYLCRNQKPHQ